MREPRAGGDHGETAEARGRLLEGRLAREIAQERQSQVVEAPRLGTERIAPGTHAEVGDDLGEPLDGIDDVRVKIARCFEGARAETVATCPAEDRHERGGPPEGQAQAL